jgi:hypothetical protein
MILLNKDSIFKNTYYLLPFIFCTALPIFLYIVTPNFIKQFCEDFYISITIDKLLTQFLPKNELHHNSLFELFKLRRYTTTLVIFFFAWDLILKTFKKSLINLCL